MDNASDGASATNQAAGGAYPHSQAPLGIPLAHERTPFSDQYAYDSPTPPRPIHSQHSQASSSSLNHPGMWSANSSQQSMPLTSAAPVPYSDSPYSRYSSSNLNLAPQNLGMINPNELADDDDWGISPVPNQQSKRRSFVPFGSSSRNGTPNSSNPAMAAGAGAAGAAAAGGALAAGATGSRDANGAYDAVPMAEFREKSEWRETAGTSGRKRKMWLMIGVLAVIIVGAIVGSVVGTQINKGGKANEEKATKDAASAVQKDNKDDLGIDSDEIKKLMDNKDLHKVFPGMDYTPLNTQYPDCLHVGPSQNNITRDLAVMSQLTNAVRLYGTDCNQTAMVLHAMDRLELKDMKLWVGVWLGDNSTTNDRQIAHFWEIIDNEIAAKDSLDRFRGVIVGNEVLFRKDLNESRLLEYIADIKQNLTDHGHSLPIATSDLGDNWTADMATKVDVVMSNVHPFFAGVEVEKAAGWTWDFWTTHDVALTASNNSIKQVVAEVGWPTGGGNGCGESTCTSSTQGSVAGISQLNTFMEDWICPSMKNKTEYFW